MQIAPRCCVVQDQLQPAPGTHLRDGTLSSLHLSLFHPISSPSSSIVTLTTCSNTVSSMPPCSTTYGEMEIFGEQEPSHNCMDQYFVLIDDVVLHFIIINFFVLFCMIHNFKFYHTKIWYIFILISTHWVHTECINKIIKQFKNT